jgi:hypothetical protein
VRDIGQPVSVSRASAPTMLISALRLGTPAAKDAATAVMSFEPS